MSARRVRRPNGGRELVVEILSSDNADRLSLQDLHERTRATVAKYGTDLLQWPAALAPYFDGQAPASRRWVRFDDHGVEHVFVLIDCGEFDLLAGVGSRRELNLAASRSGNLATEILLETLSLPSVSDPDEPLYGIVTAYELDRLWRLELLAAVLQHHAKDWLLILRTETDLLDFAVEGTTLAAVIRSTQSSSSANRLVEGGAKAKAIAHESGRLEYAAGQVHPAVTIDRAGRYQYNLGVVGVLREVAAHRITGETWEDLAEEYAHRIPAPRATRERDELPANRTPRPTSRTRQARNERRVRAGLDALPTRELPDGSPNPAWRPLTVADLDDPPAQLRALFLRGVTVPQRHRDSVEARVEADLDGIHPRDAVLAFFADGLYRRLVKDQDRSNSRITRYGYVAADLGPVDDRGYLLDSATIAALKAQRDGGTHNGSTSGHPLATVFTATAPERLYTRDGYLDPTTGRLVVRSYSDSTKWGLRIWFEPHGSRPHSAKCRSLANLRGPETCALLADLLEAALDAHPDSPTFVFRITTPGVDPVAAAETRVEDLDRRHTAVTNRLADPDLSERTEEKLKATLRELEADLTDAEHDLAAARAAGTRSGPAAYDGSFDITGLADLVALLRLGRQLPPGLARRVARLLRRLLTDATLTIDPATGTVELAATLVLTNNDGDLRLPLHGTLSNTTNDPWLAGIAGAWWHTHQPLDVLFAARGLATRSGSATRWRAPITERLLAEADASGRALPGPNTAALLARAPHPHLIRAVVEHVTDTTPTDPALTRALLAQLDTLDGDPPRQRWDQPPWRDLDALADRRNAASTRPRGNPPRS